MREQGIVAYYPILESVLGIWIRMRMFLGLPDPLVIGMDSAPDPSLFS
jgi:hypothetical protein